MVDKYKDVTQNLRITEDSFNVDILFVVDNSGSMAKEQRNMADRINNFISKVSDLNWQIGVTSTDPRAKTEEEGCDPIFDFNCDKVPLPHGDGGLVMFNEGSHILTNDLNPVKAQKYLGKAIQLGTGGSSSEEGIRATYRALEKSLSRKYPLHQDLIRKNSALAVVLISDEDESDDDHRNKPKNLIQFVKKSWAGKKSFKFHSMIDLERFNCEDNAISYGKEYEKLSRATGGVVGSVCQENYSRDLSTIGQEVREQTSTIELKCVAGDRNSDGNPEVSIQLDGGEPVPKFVVKGSKLIFESPLPPGRHRLKYICLK